MKLSKAIVMKIFSFFLVLALSAFSKLSYADWTIGIGVGDREEHHEDHHDHDGDHRFYHYHDHPHYGYHEAFLPMGCYSFWLGINRYYYFDGLYYIKAGFDYELVAPPLGAHVPAIPSEYHPVFINGITYYTDDGIYYVLTHHNGYELVPAPVVYAQPQQIIEAQPQQVIVTQPVTTVEMAPVPAPSAAEPMPDPQDSFPVNVPNNSGGYTTVVVKKSGNGYVGPQGEFYAQFPSVSQLKAMYVKQ